MGHPQHVFWKQVYSYESVVQSWKEYIQFYQHFEKDSYNKTACAGLVGSFPAIHVSANFSDEATHKKLSSYRRYIIFGQLSYTIFFKSLLTSAAEWKKWVACLDHLAGATLTSFSDKSHQLQSCSRTSVNKLTLHICHLLSNKQFVGKLWCMSQVTQLLCDNCLLHASLVVGSDQDNLPFLWEHEHFHSSTINTKFCMIDNVEWDFWMWKLWLESVR